MGMRLSGGERRSSDTPTAIAAGGLLGAVLGVAFSWAVWGDHGDVTVEKPVVPPAQVDADMIVNAAVVEMHGYGPDGKPGRFLYDCEHAKGEIGVGDPTLVCTQREGE